MFSNKMNDIFVEDKLTIGTFPPVGRFGAGREGTVLLRSVTCRISTADSTLMVGGV